MARGKFSQQQRIPPSQRQRLTANTSVRTSSTGHPPAPPHHPAGTATQDGMVYYERAKDSLSNPDELEGLFQPDPASISGKIRVDISPCLSQTALSCRAFRPLFASVSRHCAELVAAIDRSILPPEDFRPCGAYRAATCAGDTDAPAWQTGVAVNCASPQYLARFWVSRNLDDPPHMRWCIFIDPESLHRVLPSKRPYTVCSG